MKIETVIKKLRRLNEPVPIPMRLPTSDEVDTAEQQLDVKFTPDYRKFLLEASDVVLGALEPATIADPESHTHLIKIAEDAWNQMDLPKNLLPICEDNGDYFCINAKGEVVYWSHNGTTDEKWADLATWLQEVWIDENS